ncbi:MAG: sulfatase-like hydrolase/transferase [Kiritimatiellae bacterium]|nr:sulfatase-like hydrolase/transferase [Kiritimatiellia bacterium]
MQFKTRRMCLFLTLLAHAWPLIGVTHEASKNVQPLCDTLPKQPNIVICMVDDLGWNQISVKQSTMGTAQAGFITPHLEKLADQGLSFTHAYAQPNCAPTRAAMITGQYPARVHNDVYVVGNLNRFGGKGFSKKSARFSGPLQSQDVAVEAITVAEALKRNGYATAHIGKYHVGGHGGEQTLPESVGFDINIGGCQQGHQSVCFATQQGGGGWLFKGLGRGDFDRFAAPYTAQYLKQYGYPASLAGTPKHVSDAVDDAMEESVKKLSATKKPFYLQLHPYAIHSPVKSRPDLQATHGSALAGFVASIDLTISRLLKAIDDPDGDGDTSDSLAKKTLILFTSDNGGTHGHNLPLRGQKGMFTEGGLRVPLIAYWPGVIPPNTITHHMVHAVDYYPTCLELAGRGWMPPESAHPLDGESFADILRQPDSTRRRAPLFYLFPGYMDTRAQPCAVVIDEQGGKRYKLFYFYEANAWELYNLTDDIGEKENLIMSKPELASSLSKKINTWLKQTHSTWQPKFPIDRSSGKSAGMPPVL